MVSDACIQYSDILNCLLHHHWRCYIRFSYCAYFSNTHHSCTQRNAYHLVFPDNAPAEDKLTLIGSSILIDVIYAEQKDDNGGGGGGGGGGGN